MNPYGNPENRYINSITVGEDFETIFISTLKKAYPRMTNTHHDKVMDYQQGTDGYIDQMPYETRIDPTLYFDNKKYMPFIADTNIPALCGQTFQLGIRIGHTEPVMNENNKPTGEYFYRNFDKPVVVIGVNAPPNLYRLYEDELTNNIEKYARRLIDAAVDCLNDYECEPEDRQYLDEKPLKRNPAYRQNKDTNDEYRRLNKIDHSEPDSQYTR